MKFKEYLYLKPSAFNTMVICVSFMIYFEDIFLDDCHRRANPDVVSAHSEDSTHALKFFLYTTYECDIAVSRWQLAQSRRYDEEETKKKVKCFSTFVPF